LGFEVPPPKRALNHEVVTFGAVRFVLAFADVLWNLDPAWTLALGSKRLVRSKYAIGDAVKSDITHCRAALLLATFAAASETFLAIMVVGVEG
jgi:hypothetical protein